VWRRWGFIRLFGDVSIYFLHFISYFRFHIVRCGDTISLLSLLISVSSHPLYHTTCRLFNTTTHYTLKRPFHHTKSFFHTILLLLLFILTYLGIQLRTQEEDLARRKAFKNRTAANGLSYGGRNISAAAAVAPGGERVYEKIVDRYGSSRNGNGNGELL
jgi:hypothetical protein